MRKINEDRLNLVCEYIQDYQRTVGKAPALREIARSCNINSTHTVSRYVNRLSELGKIEVLDNGTRKYITVPENLSIGKVKPVAMLNEFRGTGIFSTCNIMNTVALPSELFGDGTHFILRAKDKSMIKRGIFKDDLMVVRRENTAELGKTVIAKVYGEVVTGVLSKVKGKTCIKAANDETDKNGKRIYKNIYPKSDFTILGVVDYVIHQVGKKVF